MTEQTTESMGYDAEEYEDIEAFEAFEDDDDDDEGFEVFEDDDDDDEAFFAEDDDDDDEGVEIFEDDDDDDEAFYAEDDDDDDEAYGDEDDDDDDEDIAEAYADIEGLEDVGESAAELSRRQRRRIAMLRRRRILARRKAMRAARLAASRRAKKAQKSLNRKLRRIGRPGRLKIRKYRPLKGKGVVTARLANGRTTKMMFIPALATLRNVNLATRRLSANDARQAKASRTHAKMLQRLKSAQRSAVKSLTAQQVKASKDLAKRISTGDAKNDKRISKLMSKDRRIDARIKKQIRHGQQRSVWNSLLLASAVPLYSAYGDRAIGNNANPFSKKNLILTGSLAFWLFGDELIDRFLARGGKSGKIWGGGANVWSYIAPVGNAATTYLLLKDQQHQRFITGVTKMADNRTAQEFPGELLKRIGKDYHADFKNIACPNVTATLKKLDGGADAESVLAWVSDGELNLQLMGGSGSSGSVEVSWKVDTMKPDDQRTSTAVST